ncbi:MAG: pectate lyase [Paludibacteraceae bacterium]|nr:pectate lyase [Paludibacteraceae bacterium]
MVSLFKNSKIMKKFLVFSFVFCSILSVNAAVQIKSADGWLESAFVEWTNSGEYSDYNVYVRPEGGSYTMLDRELLRSYSNYFRADALGLPAGNYQLKVVPVANDAEVESAASETAILAVRAHDRRGFAHSNWTKGVGAYKDNGELKDGTRVLYIYKGNAKTITMDVTVDSKGKVQTFTGIQAIITAYQKGCEKTPLCVRILGTLEASDIDRFDSSSEGLQIKGRNADSELNITIEGVGNDAVIRGFGILVRNGKSVEFRNFAIMSAMDDCISLDTDNSNIWIHHLDGFYGKKGSGDKAKGDGTIDVKSDSKYVTIDNCHFHDTGKSSMCGMKSESGPNYITYHHNWFDHSDSRHPRVRTMSVHVYNNYFDGVAKYCVGSTTGSSVFVENNYFNNAHNPMLISMQGTDTKNGADETDSPTFSKENGGIIKAFNNVFAGSSTKPQYYSESNKVHFDAYLAQTRSEQVPSSVTAKLGGSSYNNFDSKSATMPSITPDDPNNIPTIVTSAYGAGRMFHSDIEFSLANFDPANYEISTELSNLIVNYKSELQGIFGTDWNNLPDPTQETSVVTVKDNTLSFDGSNLYNPERKVIRIYAVTGACAGTTSRETIAVDHLPVGMYLAVSKDGAFRFERF